MGVVGGEAILGRYLDMEGKRRRRVSSGSLKRGLRTESPLVKLRSKCGSKYEADMERLKKQIEIENMRICRIQEK